ncbi:MAG: hypothetical protein GYB67_18880 [Chloroflexi bacterium]|nr:hypothetical protein [Chloroflexota bacterium]
MKRTLVLTDGFVGQTYPEYVRQLEERHLRVYAVLPGDNASKQDLEGVAHSITILPPMGGRRGPWRLPR